MRKRRKEQILKRKNFLPSLVFTVLIWILLFGVVYFIDPFTFGALIIFFILFFFATLFTSSLLLGNTRRGLLTSASLSLFLLLRYFGIGNILNFLIIMALAIVIEMLYSR